MSKFPGFYTTALSLLKKCRKTQGEIIRYPDVFSRLCTRFQIKKADCWELLLLFKELGFLELVPGHGVRLKTDF